MNLQKRCLVVKLSEEISEIEYASIKYFCSKAEVEYCSVDFREDEPLGQSRGCFDLIYLAGHGSETHFQRNSQEQVPWAKVGEWLCQSQTCFGAGCILFLATCFGCSQSVANELLGKCPGKFSSLIGSLEAIQSFDSFLAVQIFMKAHFVEQLPISTSMLRISGAGIAGITNKSSVVDAPSHK
jgi:hypothetical protein